tara:strand:- start:116 stop:406 length:291 start_codon:yes stop_codon:yes gene_type:complete
MGYLDDKDYKKLKNTIETFVDNPIIVENLFKSLVLFLETKNIVYTQKKTNYKISLTNSVDTNRVSKIMEEADIALDKYSNKIVNKKKKEKTLNGKL